VRVTNSSYHGINLLREQNNSSVKNSVIDGACRRLNDCGGIYTGDSEKLLLDLRIEHNTVSNIKASEGIGIYLDDSANNVTVINNTLTHNTTGMVLHNGFQNVIRDNTFTSSDLIHLAFSQDTGLIRANQVINNTFNSADGVQTYNMQASPDLKEFATFDYNTYSNTNTDLFANTWDGRSPGVMLSYSMWKRDFKQDQHSTMNGKP
jgi:parallel beta-helix repeat protein